MKRSLLLLLCILLVACQSGEAETTTSEPPEHKVPVLLTPEDGAEFDQRLSQLALEWQFDGQLGEDEYFDVRVWAEGEPHFGIAWTKDTRLDITGWLREQQAGTYGWSVALIEGRDQQVIREIIPEPPAQSFEVREAIPERVYSFFDYVAPGFEVELYTTGPIAPTTITFGPDDRLYILTQSGDIYRVEDDKSVPIFQDSQDQLINAVGLTFVDETIYITDGGRISTMTDSDDDGMLDTQTIIADGFPSWQYWGHSTNSLALGPDGKLYMPVGATTDHGPLNDDEPYEGTIVRMDPDGSDIEVFARGFRNPYDLTFSPSGDLFANDNNPDQLDSELPFIPAEELNHVREDGNYGFPNVFSPMAPPDGITGSVTNFLASVGSAGLTYYNADQFPEEYQDGIFAAQWGSSNTTASLPNGQRVVFVELTPTDDNTYTGEWRDFVVFDQDQEYSNPVDVTVGPEGALYVAEYRSGYIFKVNHTGKDSEIISTEAVGEGIYRRGTNEVPSCVSCHVATGDGVGPSLRDIAQRGGLVLDGISAPEYVKLSIINPDAFVVDGYAAGSMYQDYAQHLTDEEVDAIVDYVMTR